MLAAHKSVLLKQSVICTILLKQFSSASGGKVASNFAFLSESKISTCLTFFGLCAILLTVCNIILLTFAICLTILCSSLVPRRKLAHSLCANTLNQNRSNA